MTTRPVHADLIIAWANGAKIQVKSKIDGSWVTTETPRWFTDTEYRVAPPPEYTMYCNLGAPGSSKPSSWYHSPDIAKGMYTNGQLLEATFDGETRSIKSVRLVNE